MAYPTESIDPITTDINTDSLYSLVRETVEGRADVSEVMTAFERLNETLLPEQRSRADTIGGLYWPALLHVSPTRKNRAVVHLGQRFTISSRTKKYDGDFEVCALRTKIPDDRRCRGMDDHLVTLRRVLDTKVSEASDNQINLPFSRLDASIPWRHYNIVAWHVLTAFPMASERVPVVKAPDHTYPEAAEDGESGGESRRKAKLMRFCDTDLYGS